MKAIQQYSHFIELQDNIGIVDIQEVISERIWGILQDCWDRRDANGGLADPEDNTGKIVFKKFFKHCLSFLILPNQQP